MYVVLDSNIWISEFGLNSPLGAATRFFLKQNKAQIILPEVVRLETEHNFKNSFNSWLSSIRDNYRQLLTAFGTLKEIVLPDDAAVGKKATEVFSNTGLEIIEVPFSLESAKESFIKTVDGVQPSDRTQQFKDGVLWSDCVALLKKDDVYLVTNDTDFYQDRKYEKGLAKNLSDEIIRAEHSLRLLPSLVALLKDIKAEVKINEQSLADAFFTKYNESINGILARNGFEVGERIGLRKTLYATENPEMLYIEFTINYNCMDVTGEARVDGLLTVRGDGVYKTESGIFEELRNFGEELSFNLEDGEEKQVRNYVLLAGSITIGHKQITHTVRYKID